MDTSVLDKMTYRMTRILVLSFFTFAGSSLAAYTYTGAQKLHNGINSNYNRLLRPSQDVAVSIAFTLLSVNFLDIKNQQFSANGWLTVKWVDMRFNWAPELNDGIKFIYLTDSECWTPELVIDNSVQEISLIQDDHLKRVSFDNNVIWEPPSVFNVYCDVDITYYPFDTQDCGISITSWTYDLSVLVLDHAEEDINISDFEENGEWALDRVYKDKVTKQNMKSNLEFDHLEFHFVMSRKATYYVLNVLVPLILISFLGLAVFLLPAESGEKVGFSLTVLLAQAVLMTIVSNTIPTTSKNTSLLGIYVATNLVISTMETLMTVLVLRIHHREDQMSDRTRKFIRNILARLSCRRYCRCRNGTQGKNRSARGVGMKPDDKSDKDHSTIFKPQLSTGKSRKISPSDWNEQHRDPPQYAPPEGETTQDDDFDREYSWKDVAQMADALSLGSLLIMKIVITFVFMAVISRKT